MSPRRCSSSSGSFTGWNRPSVPAARHLEEVARQERGQLTDEPLELDHLRVADLLLDAEERQLEVAIDRLGVEHERVRVEQRDRVLIEAGGNRNASTICGTPSTRAGAPPLSPFSLRTTSAVIAAPRARCAPMIAGSSVAPRLSTFDMNRRLAAARAELLEHAARAQRERQVAVARSRTATASRRPRGTARPRASAAARRAAGTSRRRRASRRGSAASIRSCVAKLVIT